jgi:hypothetical protein
VPPTIPESQVGPERQSPGSSCVTLPRAGSSSYERPLAGCRLVAVLALASGCLLGKHWHLQGRGRFLEHRFGEPSSGTICSTGEPGMFLAHKR